MIGDSEDERLLGAMASALVMIDELRDLTVFEMPYPSQIQRALDRMVLHCLRRGAHPPRSVPALVHWGYDRHLDEWPLTLDPDVYPANEFLIDTASGAPTEFCHEIALSAETDNPLQEVSGWMAAMSDTAVERNQRTAFSTLRRVLAVHPLLTNESMNEVRFANKLGALETYLGDFYPKIGVEYAVDGEVFPCARCGTPLRPTASDAWWCEREECTAAGKVSAGDPVDWDAVVMILKDRRHRKFVSGPARTVLRIVENVPLSDATIRPWPVRGLGDLEVVAPGQQPWRAVVVDWHSPALLGRAIAAATAHGGAGLVVWAVAQYRLDAQPEYLEVVREHASSAAGVPAVYSELQFTEMIRHRGKESGYA